MVNWNTTATQECGGIASGILNLRTRQWVVSFKFCPLYPRRHSECRMCPRAVLDNAERKFPCSCHKPSHQSSGPKQSLCTTESVRFSVPLIHSSVPCSFNCYLSAVGAKYSVQCPTRCFSAGCTVTQKWRQREGNTRPSVCIGSRQTVGLPAVRRRCILACSQRRFSKPIKINVLSMLL